MSQPVVTKLEYLGTVAVKGGKEYSASSFASGIFIGATSFVMKSKGNVINGTRENVEVGINGTPMFPVEFNESSAFDVTRAIPLKFIFSQDCIILICKELPIVI